MDGTLKPPRQSSSLGPASTLAAGRLDTPVAAFRDAIPSQNIEAAGREVLVTLARAPLGCRVYLESQPMSGPSERIRAFEVPLRNVSGQREFRALLPTNRPSYQGLYVPVAVFEGHESRGEAVRIDDSPQARPGTRTRQLPIESINSFDASSGNQQPSTLNEILPFPKLTLIAHVESDLPNFTVFGPTPEGLRISFYISGGRWNGPRIQAWYKSEGGDWIIVRPDGVAIPNARATLETSDGALLYYQLTGTIDLGPDGYARSLANDWPDAAALSLVASVSTSNERWAWLNRLTLVGAGIVNLKVGRTYYDLYSIECDSARGQ